MLGCGRFWPPLRRHRRSVSRGRSLLPAKEIATGRGTKQGERTSPAGANRDTHSNSRPEFYPVGVSVRVIMAGSSHVSTTAARFAKHQKFDRVVMFCGPQDQYQSWQGLQAATEANRFFGFSPVLDGGWSGDHYCRSWPLPGLAKFGPVINGDQVPAPFGNSRRLITNADVRNDEKRANSSVAPTGAAVKDASGKFQHEAIWQYLFNHLVERIGEPVPPDSDCRMALRKR